MFYYGNYDLSGDIFTDFLSLGTVEAVFNFHKSRILQYVTTKLFFVSQPKLFSELQFTVDWPVILARISTAIQKCISSSMKIVFTHFVSDHDYSEVYFQNLFIDQLGNIDRCLSYSLICALNPLDQRQLAYTRFQFPYIKKFRIFRR